MRLMMYASTPRSPSAAEWQLIERARCLAAIAIKLHNEANALRTGDSGEGEPIPVLRLESSAFLN